MGRPVRRRGARDRREEEGGGKGIEGEAEKLSKLLCTPGGSVKWDALTEEEQRVLIPAWSDYRICMATHTSYADLKRMPADTLRLWKRFAAGESAARHEQAEKARSRSQTSYV